MLVVAIVEDKDAADIAARLPLETPVATIEVNAENLRVWPFESIVELIARPALNAVVRAWRGR